MTFTRLSLPNKNFFLSKVWSFCIVWARVIIITVNQLNSYSDRRQIAWPTATQTDNVRLNDDLKCNTIVCHTTQRLQRRTCPSTRNAKCCKRFICRSYCLSVPIEKCSKKQTTKESHEFRFCVLNAELQRTFFLQFFIHFIFIFFGFHIFVGEFLAVPMSAAIVFLVIYVSVCIFSASTEIWVCMIFFFIHKLLSKLCVYILNKVATIIV